MSADSAGDNRAGDGQKAGDEKNHVKGAQTLMRALDILDHVIHGPVRVADLSRKLGMSKTTAHRLAHALRSRDYLSVTADGFALGPKLLQLGAMVEEQADYVRLARPMLEQLSERTGFCAFVGQREGDWSRHLDRVTGRQRLRVATAPGDRRPVAETGLGKALLLDDDEASWAELYRKSKATAVPEKDVKAFVRLMADCKARQLVIHTSELGDEVRSIAAPVRNARGQICIAISIASAGYYLTGDLEPALSEAVSACAVAISAAAGWRP